MTSKTTFKIYDKESEIFFTEDDQYLQYISSYPNSVVLTSKDIYRIYKDTIFSKFSKKNLIVTTFNEESKILDTVVQVYKKLVKYPFKKNITLISFGGGVVQDITGFVASTLYRGVNWIYVPTTLLAMADSSVGLKTSLNFQSQKNIIGTFYSPSQIYIDVRFLKTLPKKDLLSGVGEITKFYLLQDNALENLNASAKKISHLLTNPDAIFLTQCIKESIEIKKKYMDGDLYDTGKRNILNYGHEFGHALESSSNFTIPHGSAIIIGIIFANFIAMKRDYISEKVYRDLNIKILVPNSKSDVLKLEKEYFNSGKIIKNMQSDKKRTTKDLPLILPDKAFKMIKILNLSINEVKAGIKEVTNILI